jgi:tRNA(fMet)-specific endonuclease VapC
MIVKESMPMDGKYALDTNIIIGIFRGDKQILKQLDSDLDIYIPVIVIGELLFGVEKSKHKNENKNRIEDFARLNTILEIDMTTTFYYAQIKSTLTQIGKPIPENDIWIAALCSQYQLKLITRDHHFEEIPNFPLAQW